MDTKAWPIASYRRYSISYTCYGTDKFDRIRSTQALCIRYLPVVFQGNLAPMIQVRAVPSTFGPNIRQVVHIVSFCGAIWLLGRFRKEPAD
jgi:hypothetical protein